MRHQRIYQKAATREWFDLIFTFLFSIHKINDSPSFYYRHRAQQLHSKIPASPYSMQNNGNGNGITNTPTQKHSMLDKLKLFNKEKTDRSSKTQISKRTSSSSGFSSARSERSDSSLSLNDNQPIQKTSTTANSNLKKPEILTTKNKSKMLTNSSKNGSKDSLNTKKIERKDKSPARNEMTESKSGTPKIQKIPTKAENKLKPALAAKKIEARSESRTSLSSIPTPKCVMTTSGNASNLPVCTGIPKPMAAIKGTSKPQVHRFDQINVSSEKLCGNDISKQDISNGNQNGKMPIVAPIMIDNAAANNQIINQMHQQQVLSQQNISMSDSIHSKSTNCSSNGPMTNSSESSILYRPSSESGSEIFTNIRHRQMSPSQNKIMFGNHRRINGCESPQMMKVPSNGSIASSVASAPATAQTVPHIDKFNTVPSKILHTENGVIYEEEKQVNIMPMRPLLRGYNSHLTLPTRGPRGQHGMMSADYCDDMNQGYCSDGDALRKVASRYNDIENGYMSEGSGPPVNGNGIHHKTFPGLLRARTQLPTTFEER